MTPRQKWFGLRVRLGRDAAVSQSLRSCGLEEFLPVDSNRRRLFPGFVFCRFDYQNRRAVLEVPGVLSIMGPPESSSTISDAEIARIRMLLASRLPVSPCAFMRLGQPVRIARGPLEGLEGILVRRHDDFQIVVGVEALQRSLAVDIGRELVRAVEGAPYAESARIFLTT